MYAFGLIAVNAAGWLCFSGVALMFFRGFFAKESDVFIESRRYCSR